MTVSEDQVAFRLHEKHHLSEPESYVPGSCEKCQELAVTAVKTLGVAGHDGATRLINSAFKWAEDFRKGVRKLDTDLGLYESVKVLKYHDDSRLSLLQKKIDDLSLLSLPTGWSSRGLAFEMLQALEPAPQLIPTTHESHEREDFQPDTCGRCRWLKNYAPGDAVRALEDLDRIHRARKQPDPIFDDEMCDECGETWCICSDYDDSKDYDDD